MRGDGRGPTPPGGKEGRKEGGGSRPRPATLRRHRAAPVWRGDGDPSAGPEGGPASSSPVGREAAGFAPAPRHPLPPPTAQGRVSIAVKSRRYHCGKLRGSTF